MRHSGGGDASGSASSARAVAVVIALGDVALIAYGYPWQLVAVLAFVGAAVIAAAYPAWRRAQTSAELLAISCVALVAYALVIVAISAWAAD